jgi:hypothetical protein
LDHVFHFNFIKKTVVTAVTLVTNYSNMAFGVTSAKNEAVTVVTEKVTGY